MSLVHETTPARWRRSTRCASNACVEVARLTEDAISVRDTEDTATRLGFGLGEWRDFVRDAKAGRFDRH
ncbi:uncharacterized protein DUF397 [Actinomadura pelletieri DSM 43383]|uniref:Uncharacterized protein DUF397 n=1 Tax=Actinomadura pelletieri DSM 43383 TaxID=1120940 RepID=A0A495QRN0_9ACTN|nr:DUF397 domain-containing protein [Actinomadura pelletieri]RKS76144.1 uncharacterized protein DUF397 [Actinomadura pelletieri DSM 43383]